MSTSFRLYIKRNDKIKNNNPSPLRGTSFNSKGRKLILVIKKTNRKGSL